jgi:hypothetical protein
MKLPKDADANSTGDEYVELLKVDLSSLRANAASCIASNEYKRAGTMTEEKQNIYLILYDLRGPDKDFLPIKLTTPYKGPYIVSSQYKNDVTCKHANQDTIQIFHVDRVKPFFGSLEEAQKLSRVDYQQFVVPNILAYPHIHSKMEFQLEYEDLDGNLGTRTFSTVCPMKSTVGLFHSYIP